MLLNPRFTKGFHWPGYCQTDQAKDGVLYMPCLGCNALSPVPPPPLHPLAVQLYPLPHRSRGAVPGLLSGCFPTSPLFPPIPLAVQFDPPPFKERSAGIPVSHPLDGHPPIPFAAQFDPPEPSAAPLKERGAGSRSGSEKRIDFRLMVLKKCKDELEKGTAAIK